MSQEYTKDKDIALKKLSSGRRLLEAVLVVVGIFAFYLMVALVSFSPSDTSWSQTAWYGPIHNLGGGVGVWFADTLFFTFGVLAYALPLIMLFFCWSAFTQRDRRDYVNLFGLSLRLIGSLALLLTSCGLAALNVDDLYYFASGGVIGSLLSNAILPWFNGIGATLALLSVWASGLTLFTGRSWLTIAEKIGVVVLGLATFVSNRSRRDDEEDKGYRRADHDAAGDIAWRAGEMDDDDPLLRPTAVAARHSELAQTGQGAEASPLAVQGATAYPADEQPDSHAQNPAQAGVNYPAEGAWAEPASSASLSPVQALAAEEEGPPRLGDWQRDPAAPYTPYDFTVAQQNSVALTSGAAAGQGGTPLTFMPAFSTSSNDYNPQVKQGIGPELPRPKPVRIPTRRELASYAIKIPSKQRSPGEAPAAHGGYSHCGASRLSPAADIDFPPEAGSALVAGMDSHQDTDDVEAQEAHCAPARPAGEDDRWHDHDGADHDSVSQGYHPTARAPQTPAMDLLTPPPQEEEPVDMFALEQTARLVEARLADYRVKAEVVGISPGPVITRFELALAPGVKASRISNLSRDLARSLSAMAVRVVEVLPGKPYVGLELPNKRRQTVYLHEVLDCDKFREASSPLALVLGKDIGGQTVIADLGKMPHLLVAGTTGSGKSVWVNAMILSILYKATPKEVRFIMIDPKMLELSVYEGIPHLLTKVVTDMKDAANALRWCVGEMERRYKLMSALGVRNLAGYNERIKQAEAMGRPVQDPFWKPGDGMAEAPPGLEKLPYIVVMVDEFSDLLIAVGKKVEELIARLAQKARAAGIHLVLETQRPSVDVITGLIKANIPTRIAFTVSSKIDSRTILDQTGAESLLGMGDMLYLAPNSSLPMRVHGAFVRDEEVHAVVSDWKARGQPQYINSITSAGDEGEVGTAGLGGDEELDPLFDQAVAFVIDKRRASISGVQRQFRIGYNRAARIVEQMELQGIVSPPGHNGNREVLSPPSQE
ncbi:cell division protein FtsK [Sodalis-like symbiont of Philaenus spumarius]|nr:cell division protein FtsK [Sodalis-like symbiont of Philaenus spumarius]